MPSFAARCDAMRLPIRVPVRELVERPREIQMLCARSSLGHKAAEEHGP
jgi:hypothetical protein